MFEEPDYFVRNPEKTLKQIHFQSKNLALSNEAENKQ